MLRRVRRDWFLLANSLEVQVWSSHTSGWNYHRDCCPCCYLRPYKRFLLDSQRRFSRCHHPCCGRFGGLSGSCLFILARSTPGVLHLACGRARYRLLKHRERYLHFRRSFRIPPCPSHSSPSPTLPWPRHGSCRQGVPQ